MDKRAQLYIATFIAVVSGALTAMFWFDWPHASEQAIAAVDKGTLPPINATTCGPDAPVKVVSPDAAVIKFERMCARFEGA